MNLTKKTPWRFFFNVGKFKLKEWWTDQHRWNLKISTQRKKNTSKEGNSDDQLFWKWNGLICHIHPAIWLVSIPSGISMVEGRACLMQESPWKTWLNHGTTQVLFLRIWNSNRHPRHMERHVGKQRQKHTEQSKTNNSGFKRISPSSTSRSIHLNTR